MAIPIGRIDSGPVPPYMMGGKPAILWRLTLDGDGLAHVTATLAFKRGPDGYNQADMRVLRDMPISRELFRVLQESGETNIPLSKDAVYTGMRIDERTGFIILSLRRSDGVREAQLLNVRKGELQNLMPAKFVLRSVVCGPGIVYLVGENAVTVFNLTADNYKKAVQTPIRFDAVVPDYWFHGYLVDKNMLLLTRPEKWQPPTEKSSKSIAQKATDAVLLFLYPKQGFISAYIPSDVHPSTHDNQIVFVRGSKTMVIPARDYTTTTLDPSAGIDAQLDVLTTTHAVHTAPDEIYLFPLREKMQFAANLYCSTGSRRIIAVTMNPHRLFLVYADKDKTTPGQENANVIAVYLEVGLPQWKECRLTLFCYAARRYERASPEGYLFAARQPRKHHSD